MQVQNPSKAALRYFNSAVLLVATLLTGCSTTSTSLTETAINYPLITPSTRFVGQSEFKARHLGIVLHYTGRLYGTDVISVFIYPQRTEVETTSHKVIQRALLKNELKQSIADIDVLVKAGVYRARTQGQIEPFRVKTNGHSLNGVKTDFTFTNKYGQQFNSDTYIVLKEGFFIKLRTSFDQSITPDWNGDRIAQELLPLIRPQSSIQAIRVADIH